MSTEVVREGFLCPICMADLGDGIQLQVHFDEKHDKEDPVFIQNLKDLFGKAKKKILNEDGPSTGAVASSSGEESIAALASSIGQELARQTVFGGKSSDYLDYDPVSGIHKCLLERAEPLRTYRHTDYFKGERKKRLDRNKSTNHVLIRLEKLMDNIPTDPAKRRSHEQAVVPWAPEELVKQCPDCAKHFNLTRRKHHCRLCGGVICNDCSVSISFDFARKVTNPVSISGFVAEKNENETLSREKSSNGAFSKIFGGSQEGLNSIMNKMDLKSDSNNQFRSCRLCKNILESQEARIDVVAGGDPMIVRLFEALQVQMKEGSDMSSTYVSMTESLHRGEEDYTMEETQLLRVKLLKVADNVDGLSKRIAVLDEGSGNPLQLRLQQRIRAAAVTFIKETLVALPAMPSEEEFSKLRRKRVLDAERKVAEEKEAAKVAKIKFEEQQQQQETLRKIGLDRVVNATASAASRTGLSLPIEKGIRQQQSTTRRSNSSGSGMTLGQGFVLSSTAGSNFTNSDDPLVQQIQNIQGYINQARQMGKYEEVAALEENLKELQAEYQRNQRERKELEDNYQNFKGMFHKRSPMDCDEDEYRNLKEENGQEDTQHELNEADEYDASGKNPFFEA